MVWPFTKAKSNPSKSGLPKVHYKSGAAFFESQCKFGHTTIEKGKAVVAFVLDSQKEFGTPTAVSISEDGTQLAALKVASDDGGFLTFAKTPSGKGDKLQPGDLVLWVPYVYSDEMGTKFNDERRGWVGLIRAKIKPEVDPNDPSFIIGCHYN